MFVRFARSSVLVALVISTSAPWAALQTVAWTAMFADNLRTHTVVEAVTFTFDGKHPCCLCQAIAAGKKSEQKSQGWLSPGKFEFPPLPGNFVFVAPSTFRLLPLTNTFAESFAHQPPTPPPRGIFA